MERLIKINLNNFQLKFPILVLNQEKKKFENQIKY